MKCLVTLALVLFISWPIASRGQNTSNWIRVTSDQEALFADKQIKLNHSYISVRVEKAHICPTANWWTRAVARNSKAFITAEINASYPSSPAFTDKRSSEGVALPRNKSATDIGWQRSLVQMLPTSFTSLNIRLALNTTSQDGVDNIITVASDVSNKVPLLTVAQTALGVVSGAKSLLDQMFNRNLAKSQLTSDFDMVANSALTNKPGYYVIFGGDAGASYSKYTSAAGTLKWDGITLTSAGVPIDDTSYFVVLLEAKSMFFDTKDFDVVANVKEPWAKLYLESKNEVGTVVDLKTYDEKLGLIRNNLTNAEGFLDANDSYLPMERDEVHNAIKLAIEELLRARVNKLGLHVKPRIIMEVGAAGLPGAESTGGAFPIYQPVSSGNPSKKPAGNLMVVLKAKVKEPPRRITLPKSVESTLSARAKSVRRALK